MGGGAIAAIAGFWLSGQWHSASGTVTPVVTGSGIQPPGVPHYKSWLVNCGDSDTLIVIPHGFIGENSRLPVAPDDVRFVPLVSVANAALPNWSAVVDANNIYLSKQSATGSGATPALKVVADRPHTVVQ